MKITTAELKRLSEMTPEERHQYFSDHREEINFDHLINRCRNNQEIKKGKKYYYLTDKLEDVIESAIVFNWEKSWKQKHAGALVSVG